LIALSAPLPLSVTMPSFCSSLRTNSTLVGSGFGLGERPLCAALSADLVRVDFGVGAELLPGWQVSLAQPRLLPGQTALWRSSSVVAVIPQDLDLVSPNVRLWGPSISSSCSEALTIDGSSTRGSGGRPFVGVFWSATAANSSLSIFQSLLDAIASANSERSLYLEFSPPFLAHGADVYLHVHLQVVNFLGVSATGTHTLTITSTEQVAFVRFDQPTPVSVSPSDLKLVVTPTVWMSSCNEEHQALNPDKVLFSWSEFTPSAADLDLSAWIPAAPASPPRFSNAAESAELVVRPRKALQSGVGYGFQIDVSVPLTGGASNISASAKVVVIVTVAAPVAVVKGGDRTLGIAEAATIDGSESYSPSFGRNSSIFQVAIPTTGRPSVSSGWVHDLQFAWSCVSAVSSSIGLSSEAPASACLSVASSGPVLRLDTQLMSLLNGFTLTVELTVTSKLVRVSTAAVDESRTWAVEQPRRAKAAVKLAFVPGAQPAVFIRPLQPLASNSISGVGLELGSTGQARFAVSIGAADALAQDTTWSIRPIHAATDDVAIAAALHASYSGISVCVLELHALQPDTTYILEAQVFDAARLETHGAFVRLTTPGVPVAGRATLTPAEATAAKTQIVVTAEEWKASESSLPLTYSVVLDPQQRFRPGMSADDALQMQGAQLIVPPQLSPVLKFTAAWPNGQALPASSVLNATCLLVVRSQQGASQLLPLSIRLKADSAPTPLISESAIQDHVSRLAHEARSTVAEGVGGVQRASAVNAFAGQLNAFSSLQQSAGSLPSAEETAFRKQLISDALDALLPLAVTEERVQFGAAVLVSAASTCSTLSSLAMRDLLAYVHSSLDDLVATNADQTLPGAQSLSLATGEGLAALAAVVASNAIRGDVDNLTRADIALEDAGLALLRVGGQLAAASYPGERATELRWSWLAPCESTSVQHATMTVSTAARNGQVGDVSETQRVDTESTSRRSLSDGQLGQAAGIRISEDFAVDASGLDRHVVVSLIRWPDEVHGRDLSGPVAAQDLAGLNKSTSVSLGSPIVEFSATDVFGGRINGSARTDPVKLKLPIRVEPSCRVAAGSLEFASADIASLWTRSSSSFVAQSIPLGEEFERKWKLLENAFGTTANAEKAAQWHAQRIEQFKSRVSTAAIGSGSAESTSPPCHPLVGSCVFWDKVSQGWSSQGCIALNVSNSGLSCVCDHLTDFSSILVPIRPGASSETHDVVQPEDIHPWGSAIAVVHAWSFAGLVILTLAVAAYLDAVQGRRFAKAMAADSSMQLARALQEASSRVGALQAIRESRHIGLPKCVAPPAFTKHADRTASRETGGSTWKATAPSGSAFVAHNNPVAWINHGQKRLPGVDLRADKSTQTRMRYGQTRLRAATKQMSGLTGIDRVRSKCSSSCCAEQLCYRHAWLELFTVFRARHPRHLRVLSLASATVLSLTALALYLPHTSSGPSLPEMAALAFATAIGQQIMLVFWRCVARQLGRAAFQWRFFTVWEELEFRKFAVKVLPKYVGSGIAENRELADFVSNVKLESDGQPERPVSSAPTAAERGTKMGSRGLPTALVVGQRAPARGIASHVLQARSRAVPKPPVSAALAASAAGTSAMDRVQEHSSECDAIDWNSGSSVGSSTSSEAAVELDDSFADQKQAGASQAGQPGSASSIVIDWDSDSEDDVISDATSSASSIGEVVRGGSAMPSANWLRVAGPHEEALSLDAESPTRRARAKASEIAASMSRPDSVTWLGNSLTRGFRLSCENERANLRCALRLPSVCCFSASKFSRFDHDEAEARVSILTKRDRATGHLNVSSLGVWEAGGVGCPRRSCAACASREAGKSLLARAARRARAIRGRPDHCCWLGQSQMEEDMFVNPEQCALDLMANSRQGESDGGAGKPPMPNPTRLCQRHCCGLRWAVSEPAMERDEKWRLSEHVMAQLAGFGLASGFTVTGPASLVGRRPRAHLPTIPHHDKQATAALIRLKSVSTMLALHPHLRALKTSRTRRQRNTWLRRRGDLLAAVFIMPSLLLAAAAACFLAASSLQGDVGTLWIVVAWLTQAAFALVVQPAAVFASSKNVKRSSWASWLADSLDLVAIPLAEAAASKIPANARRTLGIGAVRRTDWPRAVSAKGSEPDGPVTENPVWASNRGASAEPASHLTAPESVVWREYVRLRVQTISDKGISRLRQDLSARRCADAEHEAALGAIQTESLKKTYLDASFRKAPLRQHLPPRPRLGNPSWGGRAAGTIRVQASSRRVGMSQNTVRRSNND